MMVVLWGLQRPHSGDGESRVFTACPASYLSIQTPPPPHPHQLLTCLTSLRPAQTEALSTQPHAPSLQTLLSVSYPAIVIPKWFLNNVAPHTISPQRRALRTSHRTTTTFQPQEYIFSNVPTIFFTDFFLLVYNKPHGTPDEYKTGQSLHFSL